MNRKRNARGVLVGASLLLAVPCASRAQEVANPVLSGTAFVGDSLMRSGTVVLHYLTGGGQGQLDSMRLSPAGTFSFALPGVPDPGRSDVYFASVRHDGVLYFGPAITAAVQLDSLYEVHTYDTLVAPAGGATLAVQSRSIFFEPDSAGWRVTDLFQLRNDASRTIVTRPDGRVWSHPLPIEARDVSTGEGELAVDAADFENGQLVVRAALPPGERLFVVRYRVESPIIDIPNAQTAEAIDVLIREPAPPLEVEGLTLLDRIELEAGSTYIRFTGTEIGAPVIRITESRQAKPPPVQWAAVLLAFVFAGAGLMVLRSGSHSAPVPVLDRNALLLAVARLDEAFEDAHATPEQRRTYERRRTELLRQIRRAG
jgi:hypothetical protein